MIRAHLGETIDIHGGGLDLIFPHHENEIAQSRCAHGGAPLARYWVHNGFVDMGAEKMSKSAGQCGHGRASCWPTGIAAKCCGWRCCRRITAQPLPWTEALIAQSKAMLDGLYRKAGEAEPGAVDPGNASKRWRTTSTRRWRSLALGAIDDPAVLKASRRVAWAADACRRMIGSRAATSDSSGIEQRIAERARCQGERAISPTADRIRDELQGEGILLEDGPGGTTWRRA